MQEKAVQSEWKGTAMSNDNWLMDIVRRTKRLVRAEEKEGE